MGGQMNDERPRDVLGSLPHSRPHRRSAKRAARQTTRPNVSESPPGPPAGEPAAPDQQGPTLLATAVEAAAELAEIALSLSARAIRAAVNRLPRP
jgi:hypothetical protein